MVIKGCLIGSMPAVVKHQYSKKTVTRIIFVGFNDAPLNESNEDVRVNFFECRETSPKGKVQTVTWITDFHMTEDTIYELMKGARARWKIENETFNTLKTQGYNFEHNYNHGYKI